MSPSLLNGHPPLAKREESSGLVTKAAIYRVGGLCRNVICRIPAVRNRLRRSEERCNYYGGLIIALKLPPKASKVAFIQLLLEARIVPLQGVGFVFSHDLPLSI